MATEVIIYIEVIAMCILITGFLFCMSIRSWRPRIINSLSLTYIFGFCAMILCLVWKAIDGNPTFYYLNIAIQPLYFTFQILLEISWFDYVMGKLPFKTYTNKFTHSLYYLPALITFIFSILSIKYGWIFSIDPTTSEYVSGPGYLVYMIMGYLYFIAGSVLCFIGLRHVSLQSQKGELLTFASFPIFPCVLGIVQVITGSDIPVACFAVVLMLLITYCLNAQKKVTKDALTNLPNRSSIDLALVEKTGKFERSDGSSKLFLIIIDADRFKLINDNYGHLEGDRALQIMADVLYQVLDKNHGFVGRYGGDEFMALVNFDTEEEVNDMIKEIDKLLEEKSKDERYTLKASYGVACYTHKMRTREFQSMADAKLYECKTEHHKLDGVKGR